MDFVAQGFPPLILYMAGALGAIGLLLVLLASCINQIQSADGYDATGPLLLGLVFVCAGSLVTVVGGALVVSGLFGRF